MLMRTPLGAHSRRVRLRCRMVGAVPVRALLLSRSPYSPAITVVEAADSRQQHHTKQFALGAFGFVKAEGGKHLCRIRRTHTTPHIISPAAQHAAASWWCERPSVISLPASIERETAASSSQ